MAFVAAPDHPLVHKSAICRWPTVERCQASWCGERGSGTRTAVEQLFKTAGVEMKLGAECLQQRGDQAAVRRRLSAWPSSRCIACVLELHAGVAGAGAVARPPDRARPGTCHLAGGPIARCPLLPPRPSRPSCVNMARPGWTPKLGRSATVPAPTPSTTPSAATPARKPRAKLKAAAADAPGAASLKPTALAQPPAAPMASALASKRLGHADAGDVDQPPVQRLTAPLPSRAACAIASMMRRAFVTSASLGGEHLVWTAPPG